jgi:hypothetical protein
MHGVGAYIVKLAFIKNACSKQASRSGKFWIC